MTRRTVALVVALAFEAGCGGHEQKGSRAGQTDRIIGPVPGRLVAIGGGRSLFVHCVGSGTPSVLLEAGFGANAADWREVQPLLGRHTRTCAYDRAGIGSSVAPPGVRDARDEVGDLQRLVEHAHIDPPYVLVGHSYGGLLARLFARARRRLRAWCSSTPWVETRPVARLPSGPRPRRRRCAT